MKDIDFDELDKAVSSLMKTDEAPAVPATPPVVEPVAAPVATETPAVAPTPKPAAPATRRSGRFMDVMHPSVGRPASRPNVSRQGATVSPPSAPTSEPTPAEALHIVAETENLPDPLDVTTTPPQPDVEPATTPSPSMPDPLYVSTFSTTDEPASLESPFLADAKVEKRPLGGIALSDTTEPVVQEHPEDAPVEPITESPAEDTHDLVAIESTEPAPLAKAKPSGDSTPAPEAAVTPAPEVEAPTAPAPEVISEPTHEPKPVVESHTLAEPASGGSIPQQYKEQPSTGDQSHAAIYDSASFDQPLIHPAKKKSGWLWIVWILLLLAIGSGGAVLLYMNGLI